MKYITDLKETFQMLSQCCGEPVYTSIGTDNEGNEIAVPMFAIGEMSAQDESI